MSSLDKSGLKVGEWYLVVQCEYCLTNHIVMPDRTNGQGPLNHIQQSTCPSCLRIGLHAPNTIKRYQHLERPERPNKGQK